jgi:hypothetical protein
VADNRCSPDPERIEKPNHVASQMKEMNCPREEF